MFCNTAAAIMNSLDLNPTLAAAEGRTEQNHNRGEGEATRGYGRRSMKRVLFRDLIYTAKDP